jgi:hypothetical protein
LLPACSCHVRAVPTAGPATRPAARQAAGCQHHQSRGRVEVCVGAEPQGLVMRLDDVLVCGVARRQPTVMRLRERPIRKWFGAERARYLLATFLAGARRDVVFFAGARRAVVFLAGALRAVAFLAGALATAGADLPAAATAASLVG